MPYRYLYHIIHPISRRNSILILLRNRLRIKSGNVTAQSPRSYKKTNLDISRRITAMSQITIAMPQMGNDLFRRYMKGKYVQSLRRSGADVCWIELENPDEAVRLAASWAAQMSSPPYMGKPAPTRPAGRTPSATGRSRSFSPPSSTWGNPSWESAAASR